MATMTAAHAGSDVVGYLKEQHNQIKLKLASVLALDGDARAQAFYDLRRLLAAHETAEEEIVHPAARKALMSVGDAIVDARLAEEHEAKVALVKLEALDVDSPDFEAQLRALQRDVVAHAEAEEREEFGKLREAFDSVHLLRMRKAAEVAEAMAPGKPHPSVEGAAANLVLGPFMALVDRARDVLTGKAD